MNIRTLLLTLATAGSLAAAPAALAQSTASQNLSGAVSEVVGSVVDGAVSTLATSGMFVVDAVHAGAEGVTYVLKNASTGATVSVRVAAHASGTVAVASGTAVQVISQGAGYAIIALGKMIAYVPNAVGQELIHHSRLDTPAKTGAGTDTPPAAARPAAFPSGEH